MSWLNLNQSLNDLKGQFKNLASEVFSEGIVEDEDPFSELSAANNKIKELQNLCATQDAEIKILTRQNTSLRQEKFEALASKKGAKAGSSSADEKSTANDESSWFWDPPDGEASASTPNGGQHENQNRRIHQLQNEISTLKTATEKIGEDKFINDLKEEISNLKEENSNLSMNLEDLDSQNQIALNKVITVKRELQNKYDSLHAKYVQLEKENENLKSRSNDDEETKNNYKEMTETNMKLVSDLDTLHRKYGDLEKVHRMLQLNTEKFQEDNMELSEENFRLQEECSKLQNELEELQVSSQTAPKKYQELENKFVELEKRFAEKDKVKSVESVMEAIHDSKAQEVIAQLKFEIVELQNKLNTNEEIKRLNLEIDHLKKEIEGLAITSGSSIPCDSFKNVFDKYITFDISGVQKPSIASSKELLNYAEFCLKNFSDIKNKNESLEARISESTRTVNKLQSNVDDLHAEIEILNGDLGHYEHECSELKKNNDFLIAEIGALKSVSKLEPILEQNEEHVAKLQGELDDCCMLNKSFQEEMDEKEKLHKATLAEKVKLTEELYKLQSSINVLKESEKDASSVSSLNEKLTAALNEVEKLKNQLHTATVDNEKTKIDLTILDNDKVLLLREINELKASLQAKIITEDYANKLESEKSEIENTLQEFNELKCLSEQLMEENGQLKNKVSALEIFEERTLALLDELNKSKAIVLNQDKTLTEMESKILEMDTTLIEFRSQAMSSNETILEQCKHLSDTLGLEINDIVSSIEHENSSSYVGKVFDRVIEFVSVLENKKRELLDVTKAKSDIVEDIVNRNQALSEEINNKQTNIVQLTEHVEKLQVEIKDKSEENDTFKELLRNNEIKLSSALENLNALSNTAYDCNNCKNLSDTIQKLNDELNRASEDKEKAVAEIQLEVDSMKQEISSINEALSLKDGEILAAQEQIQLQNENLSQRQNEMSNLRSKIDELSSRQIDNALVKETNENLEHLQARIKTLETENHNFVPEVQEIKKENAELKSTISEQEKKLESNSKIIDQLEAMKIDAIQQLDQLNTEKSELINLVTQKHHESVSYHNEIQRLNGILLTENERYKELERIYAAAVDNKSMGPQMNVEEFNKLNEALMDMREKCLGLEKQLQDGGNREAFEEKFEELKEKNQLLRKECDTLTKNLIQEQNAAKQITQEKIQVIEKEQSLCRELERLREHLVEMEEEHTRELVSAEQKLQEAQIKLNQAEEKVKQSSTLYTSNSIRANQEVETLRIQIKLVEKQRDEIQAQLSESEDRNSKHLAALTNLQCVLEQFQMEKERQGEAVAGKARRDLEASREEVSRLQSQISELEEKLRDSSSGLRAASRLSAQLDAKTAQVQETKEQVSKLQDELDSWKKKYKDAVSNQQDKVDKSLVKNLLMGYIQTSHNQKPGDRVQVLRLISTVLDFDQSECERVGLGSKSSAGGGIGADSLAQEFIKFLEKESRPQLKVGLPNLLHLGHSQGPITPPHSSKMDSPISTSRASTNSPQKASTPTPQQPSTSKPLPVVPITVANPLLASASISPVTANIDVNQTALNYTLVQNPLTSGFSLFTPIANPDIVLTQTRNNEGAILKNVLKDS